LANASPQSSMKNKNFAAKSYTCHFTMILAYLVLATCVCSTQTKRAQR